MTSIDQPDYQVGVSSGQVLLGSFPGTQMDATVGVPPNAEALVIVAPSYEGSGVPFVAGVQSSASYGVTMTPLVGAASTTFIGYVDVSSVLDQEVVVEFISAPGSEWYVYADSGVHAVVDISSRKSLRGVEYSIPTVPDTATGDHPLTEAKIAFSQLSGAGTVLPAPASTARYRIFGVQMATPTAGIQGLLYDSVSNQIFSVIQGAGNTNQSYPAQGIPLSAGAAVDLNVYNASGTIDVVIQYTLETV